MGGNGNLEVEDSTREAQRELPERAQQSCVDGQTDGHLSRQQSYEPERLFDWEESAETEKVCIKYIENSIF